MRGLSMPLLCIGAFINLMTVLVTLGMAVTAR